MSVAHDAGAIQRCVWMSSRPTVFWQSINSFTLKHTDIALPSVCHEKLLHRNNWPEYRFTVCPSVFSQNADQLECHATLIVGLDGRRSSSSDLTWIHYGISVSRINRDSTRHHIRMVVFIEI